MELKLFPETNFTDISEGYKEFAKNKVSCTSCSIFDCYKTVVSSEGNAKNPTFMFIGESPGADEVENKRPFYGKAGQRLRKELRKYPEIFNKKTAIFSNVIPCRPQDNKFPSKDQKFFVNHPFKKPQPVSHAKVVYQCKEKWLDKEIGLLKPKIIVVLGSQGLFYVLGKSGITQNRGEWDYSTKYNAWTFATFHPSYVLRCQNDDSRQDVVVNFENDIKQISLEWRTVIDIPTDDEKDEFIDSYVKDMFGV